MTVQEAYKTCFGKPYIVPIEVHNEAKGVIKQALEEVEQYRALGTPTQILERIGGLDVELGKYHCLGTVEELKEAREKQVASKPYTESDGFADGVEVWEYFCPDCNFDFEEYQPKYCPKCGKKIDWSEEDD